MICYFFDFSLGTSWKRIGRKVAAARSIYLPIWPNCLRLHKLNDFWKHSSANWIPIIYMEILDSGSRKVEGIVLNSFGGCADTGLRTIPATTWI